MKFYLMFSIILFCLSSETNAMNRDSSNRYLTFSYFRQELYPANYYYQTNAPFKDAWKYSFSVLFQKEIYSYKKLEFNTYLGLTTDLTNIGSIDVVQYSKHIQKKINYKSFDFALSSAFSVDIRVLKHKKSELKIGTGILTNGYFLNTMKSQTYLFDRENSNLKDSIIITSLKNNTFGIVHFYQLNLIKKIKNKSLMMGVRLFMSDINDSPNNIEYEVYPPSIFPPVTTFKGQFINFNRPFAFLIGYSF
ncbi:MAG: hypothetical protein Q8K70_05620 [Bacteroidota bacterium]|nr:hypothetical protein [Bacteroidota bacterium]